jgi:hypothetical protein
MNLKKKILVSRKAQPNTHMSSETTTTEQKLKWSLIPVAEINRWFERRDELKRNKIRVAQYTSEDRVIVDNIRRYILHAWYEKNKKKALTKARERYERDHEKIRDKYEANKEEIQRRARLKYVPKNGICPRPYTRITKTIPTEH